MAGDKVENWEIRLNICGRQAEGGDRGSRLLIEAEKLRGSFLLQSPNIRQSVTDSGEKCSKNEFLVKCVENSDRILTDHRLQLSAANVPIYSLSPLPICL